jgi:hypothetical protein
LRWRWVLLPGLAVPFLGGAYSRACEYTCDRYGLAASRDRQRALDGLCILAAGGRHGPQVNRRALTAQRADLNTTWMKIGQWLSTYPPVAARLAALDPTLDPEPARGRLATFAAASVIGLAVCVPLLLAVTFVRGVLPRFEAALKASQDRTAAGDANATASAGIASLAGAAERYRSERNQLPPDVDALYAMWTAMHPTDEEPADPYDGARYGYAIHDADYVIWSSGPDEEDDSDDLYYSSAPLRPNSALE